MQSVYFIRQLSTGLVKIGRTNNIRRRMRQLAKEHGELELLHLIETEYVRTTIHKYEQALHYHFRKLHHHLEWFHPEVMTTARTLDLKAIVRAYKDSRLCEVRLPKPLLAQLNLRGMTIEQAVTKALGSV